jgi:hypothetical protein
MSSRPLIKPFQVITNGNMSGNITSVVTIIDDLSMVSYDISWTNGSSPMGAMSVQVSNTYKQNSAGQVLVTGNWTTVPLGTNTTTINTNTGNGFIDIDTIGAYAIRLVYTANSGSGTMQAFVVSKVQ